MSKEKDQIFFRNFSIIVIILAVMMVVFLIAANMIGGTVDYGGQQQARAEAVAERTAPVGDVRVEGETAPEPEPTADAEAQVAAADDTEAAADDEDIGKTVYDKSCAACHAGGLAGAPPIGNPDAWAPRIEQGMDTLYTHAIEGFQGDTGMMPARGGDSSLSDEEVKAAVDYMVAESE